MSSKKPLIAVTMGDAAGVGPELCLKLLHRFNPEDSAIPVILGHHALLARVAREAGLALNTPGCVALDDSIDRPVVLEIPTSLDAAGVQRGRNQWGCGALASSCIESAIDGCLARRFAAMVTAPISKKALNMAGIDYPGHTEMLADQTNTHNYAMLLYSAEIACAFATCHQSLCSVSESLSVERIVQVAELGATHVGAMRGIKPRLCLLGLNPHAGEEGLFGDEEIRLIIPARKKIEALGIAVDGPLPPDTAFTPSARKRYDCYIAMYHDQGSIPFKMLAFDTGVNITMGLPIIRTSPDHGTAFDIAWKGVVQPDSFFSAYDMAVKLALAAG